MKRVALIAAVLAAVAAIIAAITTFSAGAATEDRMPTPGTDLVITFSPSPQVAVATVWTLRCDGPGPVKDVHPDPARACAHLKSMPPGENPFAPVRVGEMCTMIYGGPQHATITGHWRGMLIRAKFNRENGCEIYRWDHLVPVLPAV